ncbi:MAG: hypothetical protein ABSA63_05990 [Thermoplasmata archaeon]|jgi:hypothetical protein
MTMILGGSVLLLLVPVATATAPSASWGIAPPSWSNGLVLCEFSGTAPMVGVSALALAETGLSASVGSISEVTSGGVVQANASLSSTVWTATNFSNDDAYDLGYTAHAPVTGSAAPFHLLGAVDLRVDFVLPIYSGSPSGPTDTVSMGILVSNWSWQGSGDHLVLTLHAWPSYAGSEHLLLGSSPGLLVSGVATSGGATLEEMSASTSAVANPASPTPVSIAAAPSVTGNSAFGVVSVSFGSNAGEFSGLSYSSTVHVLLPTTIAGIPTTDLVAVGGTAGLVTVLIALAARRARRRPSDLTYVNEEEK